MPPTPVSAQILQCVVTLLEVNLDALHYVIYCSHSAEFEIHATFMAWSSGVTVQGQIGTDARIIGITWPHLLSNGRILDNVKQR